MKDFPSKLREIRKQKGFTQESISQLLGIGQSSYAKWENGKTEPIQSGDAEKGFVSTFLFLRNTLIPSSAATKCLQHNNNNIKRM